MSDRTEDPLVYPDGWPCKLPRAPGAIAKGCTYPACDCGRLARINDLMEAHAGTADGAELDRLVQEQMDSERALAFDDPDVVMLPILRKYEP
jgi:hypothetical protein